ncbi:hypothetical protein DB895_11540 [Flavobacterium psychrotolerans]|uniref:Uncharacterized protein n=1 Tax=Flavobacterium psychrotolerans TaxID=2169410 RepID=A0A2U1JH99_9FLAO|nr:hypothetical protein DB895_11540 [Flavobacterium psychrotolerans]
MDFYSNKNRMNVVRVILLIVSVILLFLNIYNSYKNSSINYLGIVSNILLIFAMTIGIIENRTNK